MIELRQTTLRFFLPLFVAVLFLFPVFIYAQKSSEMLPQKYAESEVGDINSLQQMLKEGISINAVDRQGNSLLMIASYQGDLKKVKFLIDAGADINQRNESNILAFDNTTGNTALDYAISGRHKKIVNLFLSLNVDVNATIRKATSTISKCGMTHNYEMLHYLLQKGVVVSDENKINTIILALPSGNAPMSQEAWQIIQLFLRDMEVEADDLWKSSLLDRDNTLDVKKVEQILTMQGSYEDSKWVQVAKQRSQDSLRVLLKSGQADTIHYTYTSIMTKGSDAWDGEITVTPRVDFVENEQGNTSLAVFCILLGLTALVVYYCSRQIVRHVFKEKPTSVFPYMANYLIGGLILYFIFSCIYRNLDDIMVRKQGEEKIAVLNSEGRWYRTSRSKYQVSHMDYCTDHSFVFTGNDSIRIAVEKGNTCFDADDYQEEDQHVKVRYDSASHKLSVDNDRYFMQNLIWISFMGLLLLLIFMFCWGVFNGLLNAIGRRLPKAPENRKKTVNTELDECLYEEGGYFVYFDEDPSIYTFWTFTSKEYLSKADFICDVQQSEEQNGVKPDKRIHPDKVLFDFPSVSVYFSDGSAFDGEDLRIEIPFDDGVDITEGELLFRLHNQMIPYLDRLSDHTIVTLLSMGYWTKNGEVECAITFQSELEEDE